MPVCSKIYDRCKKCPSFYNIFSSTVLCVTLIPVAEVGFAIRELRTETDQLPGGHIHGPDWHFHL